MEFASGRSSFINQLTNLQWDPCVWAWLSRDPPINCSSRFWLGRNRVAGGSFTDLGESRSGSETRIQPLDPRFWSIPSRLDERPSMGRVVKMPQRTLEVPQPPKPNFFIDFFHTDSSDRGDHMQELLQEIQCACIYKYNPSSLSRDIHKLHGIEGAFL
jgi:hypothetical protein